MAQLTRDCQTFEIVRFTALSVIGNVYAVTRADALLAFEQFARTRIIMIGEPDEMLISPETLLTQISEMGGAYGDCDDASMVIAALCIAIGVPVRFRAVGGREDGSYRHVFAEALNGKDRERGPWMPLDSTVPFKPCMSGNDLIVEV